MLEATGLLSSGPGRARVCMCTCMCARVRVHADVVRRLTTMRARSRLASQESQKGGQVGKMGEKEWGKQVVAELLLEGAFAPTELLDGEVIPVWVSLLGPDTLKQNN